MLTSSVAEVDSGLTDIQYYWWGYRANYSKIRTDDRVSDFNAMATVGGTASTVLMVLGATAPAGIAGYLTSGYISLLANRLDKYNHGNGVTLTMTSALVYSVVSQ